VLAHLRKGETYTDLALGFGIGTTTVFRYIREALDVLAALAPTLHHAITVSAGKAFVILDGTLLSIDRVAMSSGRDRPYYSGKHKRHGVNVQVLADPAGRLIWASGALPGARHDMGAAREHGLLDALTDSGVQVIADSGYRGTGFAVPQRRRPADPETGRRRLSRNQREVNSAHARQRGPWRARQRLAQELEGPPQDPLLPAAGDQPRQGRPSPHPRWLTPSGKDSVSVISSGFG
jgi:hypothetical protein